MNDYWAYHFMLQCCACDIEKIKDIENIKNFAKDLVKQLYIQDAYGEPQVLDFKDKGGYTLTWTWWATNICAHFCIDTGDVYLDFFAPKPFLEETITEIVNDYFSPSNYLCDTVVRDAHPRAAGWVNENQ